MLTTIYALTSISPRLETVVDVLFSVLDPSHDQSRKVAIQVLLHLSGLDHLGVDRAAHALAVTLDRAARHFGERSFRGPTRRQFRVQGLVFGFRGG